MWQIGAHARIRDDLEQRYHAADADAVARAGHTEMGVIAAGLRLPPAVRETLVSFGALLGACPKILADHCEHMPRQRIEQLARPAQTGTAMTPADLLRKPLALSALPRLHAALHGAYHALSQVGLDSAALLGAPSPEALLVARPTLESGDRARVRSDSQTSWWSGP